MDKQSQGIEENLSGKELQRILKKGNLEFYRKQVKKYALELEVDVLDYTAALVCFLEQKRSVGSSEPHFKDKDSIERPTDMKMVSYRLEVGRKHEVSADDIKKVLIEEAGVEKKRVGHIDLHHYHCIVSLPSGMPSDIFFHLKKVSINQQALNISRVGGKNRNFRRNSRRVGERRTYQNRKKGSSGKEK